MNIKLILGNKCNLNCKYCYQKKDDTTITKEVLDKLIERINNYNKKEYIYIQLFGREPLLYINEIFYLINRVNLSKVKFSITTNGILKENFEKLQQKLGYYIPNLLSNKCDKNYKKLNIKSSFRFIVTKENINTLTHEVIDSIYLEYKNNFSILFNFYENWEKEYLPKIEEISNYIFNKKYRITILLPFHDNSPKCNNTSVNINWNGDYLACHRNENSVIGNIFDEDFKIQKLSNCIYKNDICKNFIYTPITTYSTYCEYDAVPYC